MAMLGEQKNNAVLQQKTALFLLLFYGFEEITLTTKVNAPFIGITACIVFLLLNDIAHIVPKLSRSHSLVCFKFRYEVARCGKSRLKGYFRNAFIRRKQQFFRFTYP